MLCAADTGQGVPCPAACDHSLFQKDSNTMAVGLLLSSCSCLWRSAEVSPDQVRLVTLLGGCSVLCKLQAREAQQLQAPNAAKAPDSVLALSKAI